MTCEWPRRIREIGVANIAHRGASAHAPENTRAALALGFEMGAHAAEFDLRLSGDGVPVVIHDARVDRTTDGTGHVDDLTLEEIRALDAGAWFSSEFGGQRVPTLSEVLAVVPSDGLINVELKGDGWTDRDLEDKLLSQLDDPDLGARTVVSSFDAGTIRRVAALSEICGTSLRVRATADGTLDPEGLVHACDCVNLEVKMITPETVERLHEAGLVVEAYTVNEEREMRRLIEAGVDAIFTDRPDRLAAILEEVGVDGNPD